MDLFPCQHYSGRILDYFKAVLGYRQTRKLSENRSDLSGHALFNDVWHDAAGGGAVAL